MSIYTVLATVEGEDNTLLTETTDFNHALRAKEWATEQGYININFITFTELGESHDR